MDLEERRVEESLGEKEGGESVIEMYSLREESTFNFKTMKVWKKLH